MKRNVWMAFILAPFLFAGCGKTDTECVPATVASEKAAMVAYCTANNITYTEHASGILYEVMAPGLGTQPTLTNTVSTVYTGKLLNGNQFDASANPVSFLLSGVIKGMYRTCYKNPTVLSDCKLLSISKNTQEVQKHVDKIQVQRQGS